MSTELKATSHGERGLADEHAAAREAWWFDKETWWTAAAACTAQAEDESLNSESSFLPQVNAATLLEAK